MDLLLLWKFSLFLSGYLYTSCSSFMKQVSPWSFFHEVFMACLSYSNSNDYSDSKHLMIRRHVCWTAEYRSHVESQHSYCFSALLFPGGPFRSHSLWTGTVALHLIGQWGVVSTWMIEAVWEAEKNQCCRRSAHGSNKDHSKHLGFWSWGGSS